MTREEAIFILRGKRNIVGEKTAEALDIAIKAIEQEPCEKDWRFYFDHGYAQAKRDLSCEDAISRQAVLNTLDNMDKALDVDRTVENYKELLKECYEGLLPVTPQPKIGHWINADGDNAICGCCNRLNHLYGTYCKHCGAKMEVEKNG